MYLSRIQLNPRRRQGMKLIAQPQAMHAAVLSSFPETGAEHGRVLWRVDVDQSKTWLYVLSKPRPDFAHIIEQAGWPTTQDGWVTRDYQPLLERLHDGQQWAFRLTANPTKTVRIPGQEKSQRVGHVSVKWQEKWLTGSPCDENDSPGVNRAEGWGFQVAERDGAPNLLVHNRVEDRFRRQDKFVTITRATFDGVLIISDVAKFRQSLVDGMGPAKAYGCGLLTLAPLVQHD